MRPDLAEKPARASELEKMEADGRGRPGGSFGSVEEGALRCRAEVAGGGVGSAVDGERDRREYGHRCGEAEVVEEMRKLARGEAMGCHRAETETSRRWGRRPESSEIREEKSKRSGLDLGGDLLEVGGAALGRRLDPARVDGDVEDGSPWGIPVGEEKGDQRRGLWMGSRTGYGMEPELVGWRHGRGGDQREVVAIGSEVVAIDLEMKEMRESTIEGGGVEASRDLRRGCGRRGDQAMETIRRAGDRRNREWMGG